jgi:hypothetical protein
MIIVYGHRMYGRIDQCGTSFVGTQFVHIWYLPLIPTGSSLVLASNPDGSYRGIPVGISGRSVLAGYSRVWGPIALIAAIVSLVANLGDAADLVEGIVTVVVCGLGVALALGACVLGWGIIGRLSREEKQRRTVYAHYTGYYVDPADMKDARHAIREHLLGQIVGRAQGLAGMGYRVPADPTTHWATIALDPTVTDMELIGAAFTLARVDGSLGQGPYKQYMDATHHGLWDKLRRMNPPWMQAIA